eukprot:TRINITY_DN27943_c0_g1_i1.p1 TRINITY_DN27943_c0_g1~~TRINITY_DN27943_c0_g1_i1.p1  ORF type:complete len:246 (+),score=25.26 TRINITY_DN27943_c0_g1_i1:73-810(+)
MAIVPSMADEDESLMMRPRTFLGIKFPDDVSQATAQKVLLSSAALMGMSLAHFCVHVFKNGHFGHAIGQLFLGCMLPMLGYIGASRAYVKSARTGRRLLYIFHICSILHVVLNLAMFMIVMSLVVRLDDTSKEVLCNNNHYDDPHLPVGHKGGPSAPRFIPTLPPRGDTYQECLVDVAREQQNAYHIAVWWGFSSLPVVATGCYAAYHGFDLYFQIAIADLNARVGVSGEATVNWEEGGVEEALD